MPNADLIKEVNFIPYRLVRPVYTIPASAPVQITPLFRTGKNTNHTGEIQLFQPVNGYQVKIEKSQRKILMNFQNLPKVAALGRSQSWS